MIIEVVEGWTEQIVAYLESDGAPPAAALSGTVTLILTDASGTAVVTTGDVTTLDATTWKVGYTPDATDFAATVGPYTAHWKVEQAGAVFFFPRGAADVFRIYRP